MAIPASPEFQSTRWSLVLRSRDDVSEVAQRALAELCELYWYPLYGFIRRTGGSTHDAEDLTQEFLYHFLRRHDFGKADPGKGRLRSQLLGALKNFLANEHERNSAEKRGGGAQPLPFATGFDRDAAESRFESSVASADALSPERIYDRQWALATMDWALSQLRTEYRERGKAGLFATLEPFLTWNSGEDYSAAAEKLGIGETAVRVGVHRLRERFRRALRSEIAHTVGSEDDLEEELKNFPRLLA